MISFIKCRHLKYRLGSKLAVGPKCFIEQTHLCKWEYVAHLLIDCVSATPIIIYLKKQKFDLISKIVVSVFIVPVISSFLGRMAGKCARRSRNDDGRRILAA